MAFFQDTYRIKSDECKPFIDHNGSIDIRGVNKVELLRLLFINAPELSNTKPDLNGYLIALYTPDFDEKTAEQAVKKHIDKFQNIIINLDISGDVIDDPTEYELNARPTEGIKTGKCGKGMISAMVVRLRKDQP